MITVYIAGPYRGPNAWAVEQNIRKAEALAFQIAEVGAVPLCPHSLFRYFNGTINDQFWLDATAELLKRCDAILLTDNWDQSAGARGEVRLAVDLGLPLFRSAAHCIEWICYGQG